MQSIDYEWVVNELDGEDIADVNHFARLADAIAYSQQIKDRLSEIELVREEGSLAHGIRRTWAKLDMGLPDYFCDSAHIPRHKVPKRFHQEVKVYGG